MGFAVMKRELPIECPTKRIDNVDRCQPDQIVFFMGRVYNRGGIVTIGYGLQLTMGFAMECLKKMETELGRFQQQRSIHIKEAEHKARGTKPNSGDILNAPKKVLPVNPLTVR
jgi:hypothetical protein